MSIQAIWLKILSGKPLTEAEELAWHNHWCADSPTKRYKEFNAFVETVLTRSKVNPS